MSKTNETASLDPVGRLAEEFMARYREGERPALAEYTDRYPEYAERIRQLFPMMVVLEQAGSGVEPTGDATAAHEPPAAPLALPEQIGGYRILRMVGRGGMGVVYEAEQLALGRHVALKVLPVHAAQGGSGLERFHREARAAAGLHHTNIVPVFEVGRDGEVWYYAMQFIRGQALDEVIDEMRRLRCHEARNEPPARPSDASLAESLLTGFPAVASATTAEGTSSPSGRDRSSSGLSGTASGRDFFRAVARIGQQVAEALDYAHREGVLHRDIKPGNLLLDVEGRAWVVDFGLARSADTTALTQAGDIIGTVRYMAPERFDGRGDARSDVYALGLTLYELLALRPAFDGADRARLVKQINEGVPLRLRKHDPAIPRDLETIVHKSIERDPAHRYGSAAALADDLRRVLEDRPIAARRVRPTERMARWARRNPWVAGLTAAVFGLLIVLSAVSTVAAVRIQREARRTALAASRAEAEARRAEGETSRALRATAHATAARDAEARARKEVEAANASLRSTQDELRRSGYAARMNLVQAAFDAGNVARGATLLDQALPRAGEPDLRGFEWSYWRRQAHVERSSHRLSPLASTALLTPRWVLSTNGTRAAAAVPITARRTDLLVLDTATLRPLFRRSIAAGSRAGLALNADGTRLAVTGLNTAPGQSSVATARRVELQVWDVAGGRLLLSHHEEANRPIVPTPTLSADGTRVAMRVLRSASSGSVHLLSDVVVWEIATGLPLLRIAPMATTSATAPVFGPDGTRLAVIFPENSANSNDDISGAREWDLVSGQQRNLLPQTAATRVTGLAYSPDGTRLAIARYSYTRQEATIEVREAATGTVLWTATDPARGLGFSSIFTWSPDGFRLAVAGSNEPVLRIYDGTRGQLLQDLHGHAAGLIACAFRTDGTGLVSIGADAVLKTWDIAAGEIASSTTAPIDHDVRFPALSRDGDRFALVLAASPGDLWTVVVRETTGAKEVARITIPRTVTQRELVELSPQAQAVAICESSPLFISSPAEHRLTVADVATGEVRFQLREADLGRGLSSLSFAPDGKALALVANSSARTFGNAAFDNEVQVRDARDGRVLARWGVKNATPGLLAYRGDSRVLAVTDSETRDGEIRGLIRLFDPASGRVVRTLEANAKGFSYLSFAPDGTYLAAQYNTGGASSSDPGDLVVWNLALPGASPHWAAEGGSRFRIAAFSADGRRLAVARLESTDECQIRLLDTTSGQEMLTRSRKGGHPDGLAFTPDGHRLLVTLHGADSTAHLATWEAGPLAIAVEAALLVDRLADDRLTRDEVRAAVAAEPGLPAELRAEALKEADAWPQDGPRLMAKSRGITGQPARSGADYQRALRYAEAMLAMAPDDAEVHYCRGLARLRVGQLAAARDDLTESVRTDPNSAEAWAALALTEARLGRQAQAFDALGRMTRLVAATGSTAAPRVPPDIKREAEALILDPSFPEDPFAP